MYKCMITLNEFMIIKYYYVLTLSLHTKFLRTYNNASILFYSILFYSILFHSILFYSILFYSILFYLLTQNLLNNRTVIYKLVHTI